MRTIAEIVRDAGGAKLIAEASNGAVSRDAVYKWVEIGIPDRHWPFVIALASSSPDELYDANRLARGDILALPEPERPATLNSQDADRVDLAGPVISSAGPAFSEQFPEAAE